LTKSYHVTKELLLDRIESSQINWKEGKNYTEKKVTKTLKNKKTGEKKTEEKSENVPSFFNFFTNLRLPTIDEIKKIDFETEKELGGHLDTEYEIGLEFVEEIIPHALEYFIGVSHDAEEYLEYVNEQVIEQQEKGKGKKNKKHKQSY
jgi:nucleosome assembly protein 1-like 1